jgi:anti-anti-sigma regulatory factor
VSISEFVRRPVPLGLRRARGSTTAASAARSAGATTAAPGGLPVLRLACNLADDRAGGLAEAVLARLAELRTVGTVVLELDGAAGLDDGSRQALCELPEVLRRRGTGLRLVVTSREVREDLAAAMQHRLGAEAVHDCARAAMLAAFAQAPGPGLVGAVLRDALAAQPDRL